MPDGDGERCQVFHSGPQGRHRQPLWVAQFGMTNKAERAEMCHIASYHTLRIVKLQIFGARVAQVVIEGVAIIDIRQQGLGKTQANLRPLIVHHRSNGVAVPIARVFVRACVIDGEVRELQLAVATDLIHVEVVE